MKKYQLVIWDWNGTLLDDAEYTVGVINKLLARRDLPQIRSLEEYHKIFCFPIVKHYENAGFDLQKEKFADIAEEFHQTYYGDCSGLSLNKDTKKGLDEVESRGYKQIILSATEKQTLLNFVGKFNISHYFDEILGLSNRLAASKVDIGKEYLQKSGIQKAVIIGDTLHDIEVAKALNIDCISYSGGHNSKDELKQHNAIVIDELTEVLDLI